MKKILILLLLCSIITCCSFEKKDKVPEQKIEKYLKELQSSYPNFRSNKLVNKEFKSVLLKQIDSIVNAGELQDFVMEVYKIKENPHGKGAIVQLKTKQFPSNESLAKQVKFDLISFMSTDLAKSMKKNGKYFIYAKNYKRLNTAETCILTNQTYYSTEMEVTNSDYLGAAEIELGVFCCEVDSVKRIKPIELIQK